MSTPAPAQAWNGPVRGLGFQAVSGYSLPLPKDGPVNPAYPNPPVVPAHGPIQHYEWWVNSGLARGDQPTSSDIDYLAAHGFKSIINLRLESNADQAQAQKDGLNYVQIDWKDRTAPTEAQIKQILDFATAPQNQPAYIHCLAGLNRTSVAVACYRMAAEGWSLDQAMQEAQKFGLHEPAQIAFVQQFAKDLAAGKIAGYPLTPQPPPPPPPGQNEVTGSATPNAALHGGQTVTSTLHLSGDLSAQKLALSLKLTHRDVNGLSVTLTSPSGKTVKVPIAAARDASAANVDLSSAFANEPVAGDWKLTVTDAMKRDSGTLASWSLDAKGAGTTPTDPGSVKLFPMPDSGPTAILNAINSAQHSVDLSCYLITDSKIFDALKAAAKRGVAVRVMMEPQLASPAGTETFQQKIDDLKAAGVQAQATPPQYDSSNNVDHAKFFIADGGTMFLGTGNLVADGIGDTANAKDNRDFWLEDTRPESATEAEALFNADWNRQSTSGIDFQNLVVTPDNADTKLISLIDGAKKRLYVYNQELQYGPILQHLIAAKQRGVDVEVLGAGPRSGASPDRNAKAIQELTAAGIPAKELKAFYLHAKAIVADDQAYLGSQNFSVDGMLRNRELGDIVSDPAVVQTLVTKFQADIAGA